MPVGPEQPFARRDAVTAVVLNFRAPEQTALAVVSLNRSFVRPSSVVVVDNGAEDQRALNGALKTMRCDDAVVIGSARNLGFAGGCNLGIDAALSSGAAFVLLLNSDAVLAPDALTLMVETLNGSPSAGIAGPVVVARAEPGIIESAGISFDRTTGRMRLRQFGRPIAEAVDEPFEVAAVSGCAMLIRRAVFERIGRLDEAYFYSFEDLDFCLRARDAGFSVWCVPRARAHHEGGQAIGPRSARRVYFATRNHLRLSARLHPNRIKQALTAGRIVALNSAYALTSADAPLWSGLAAVARGTWHHLIGRYGPDAAA